MEEVPFGTYALLKGALYRIGALLGVAVFFAACLLADSRILRIEVQGTGSYYEERVLSLLEEKGLAVGKAYSEKGAKEAERQILSLPDVEFCTLRKKGSVILVEIRVSVSPSLPLTGDMLSPVGGKVASVLLLRGVPCVQVGQTVEKGDILVKPQEGEQTVLASVKVQCTFYGEGKSREEALSPILLELAKTGGEIVSTSVEEVEGVFSAAAECVVTVRRNI